MSANFLANELTALASESKRKNSELRHAADKSLLELKGLPATSEQQLAADLSRRPAFIEPFIIACATHNGKFAGSGVVCLQRMVISKALPISRLQDTLEAFNACSDLGLDIQLKVLQALPSLLQNYSSDLKGDLLSSALQVCSSLQSAKVHTVSGVAAATLQQLVASVFEKATEEDSQGKAVAAVHEAPGDDGSILLRPAAFDAYRVFRDLALIADARKTKFVQFTSLSQESSLELIWSCISAHYKLIDSHPELRSIIQSNVLPLATSVLSEKLNYPISVRCFRILDLLLERYFKPFSAEYEVVLGLAVQALDPDLTPIWKRAITMEMLRDFFGNGNLLLEAYARYDMAAAGKPIIQDLLSTFVRMSAEKPSLIGLGQQSTSPVGPTTSRDQAFQDMTVEAAGGVAGVISSALGVSETTLAGVSTQWSLPKTSCLDQLDKSDALNIPETYVYALVLECLNNLSDCLAKVTLPLTVQQDKARPKSQDNVADNNGADETDYSLVRSQSFGMKSVPLNPLEQGKGSERVRAVAGLVETCWPAVLATAATFLNAALDDQYYRNLIKAYQRFTQVAGLLRLRTARDALMTTLGKTAVPPHVLSTTTAEPPKSPISEGTRSFPSSKSLLSVDNLVGPLSAERERRISSEPLKPMLTTRNLLCLRALLNLAIALGPTLDSALTVVIETLRLADVVLSSATAPHQLTRQNSSTAHRQTEPSTAAQAFGNEVAAVEAAASRLLESTADYPNDAFLNVLNTFYQLLRGKDPASVSVQSTVASPVASPSAKARKPSALIAIGSINDIPTRDYKFVIPKLGHLAELNVLRFIECDPVKSGWNMFTDELVALASNNSSLREARRASTDVLCKVAAETVAEVMDNEVEIRSMIQRRALSVLLRTVDSIYAEDGDLTAADIDVQGYVVDSVRAIIERCGESLVAGWNRTVAILSSVFERDGTPPHRQDDEEAYIDWEHISQEMVSVPLGRTAFAAVQLVCSDFLAALPTAAVPSLIELLFRFSCQNEDLNISLTTITMAWNVSDFLLNSISMDALNETAIQAKEADDMVEEIESEACGSGTAQWLLLLLKLQEVIGTCQREVRKAAFQTLCSIFRNRGEQLAAITWDLTLRNILLKVAFNDAFAYLADEKDEKEETSTNANKDEGTSVSIIGGIAEVIAQHLHILEQVKQLPSLWEAFLSRMEAYLDVQSHSLNAAVYQALAKVVARVDVGTNIWTGPMYRTLHLWLKRNPALAETEGLLPSQESSIAYVEAGTELYRLTQQSMTISQTRTMVENLFLIIRHSGDAGAAAVSSNLSVLQARVFELLKSVRSDSPSTLVIVGTKLVTLHLNVKTDHSVNSRPAFAAVSSEAIEWLQNLVLGNVKDLDLLETGDFVNVVQGLRHLVEEKYHFKQEYKRVTIWRRATAASLALVQPLLSQCEKPGIDTNIRNLILKEYTKIAGGVVGARGLDTLEDTKRVDDDEKADISSFRELSTALTRRLGDVDVPDSLGAIYIRALFENSIIHPAGASDILGKDQSPLDNVSDIRRGRVEKISPSKRESMCYECLSELVVLSSKETGSSQHTKLAQAAAPFLILRLAIPLRAYIADQPLRGRKPQPLSELEELLHCFKVIKSLRLEPRALTSENIGGRWAGEQGHLHYLYPLLAKALAIASNRWCGTEEVLMPLQTVLEAIAVEQ